MVSLIHSNFGDLASRDTFRALAYTIAGIFGLLTFRQSLIWKNEVSLWKNTIKYSKGTYPYLQYAKSFIESDDVVGAIDIFNQAVLANPYDPEIYAQRGHYIMQIGDYNYAPRNTFQCNSRNNELS